MSGQLRLPADITTLFQAASPSSLGWHPWAAAVRVQARCSPEEEYEYSARVVWTRPRAARSPRAPVLVSRAHTPSCCMCSHGHLCAPPDSPPSFPTTLGLFALFGPLLEGLSWWKLPSPYDNSNCGAWRLRVHMRMRVRRACPGRRQTRDLSSDLPPQPPQAQRTATRTPSTGPSTQSPAPCALMCVASKNQNAFHGAPFQFYEYPTRTCGCAPHSAPLLNRQSHCTLAPWLAHSFRSLHPLSCTFSLTEHSLRTCAASAVSALSSAAAFSLLAQLPQHARTCLGI